MRELLRIINDILDFSKLEADKVALEIEPFSVKHLVHSLTDLLSLPLTGKDVRLEVDCSPAAPMHVMGDTRPLAAAAGIDGDLTKPVDMELLQAEILRCLGNGGLPPHVPGEKKMPAENHNPQTFASRATPAVPLLPPNPHVDVERAVSLLGGNEQIYHFMVRRFCESWANVRDQIASAGDFETKRRLAHALKGPCASLGSQQVSDLAAKVEQTCRSEREPSPAELESLFSSVDSLRLWLQNHVQAE